MKDRNRPIIIFCQAPADLPYVLALYEENLGKRPISIYVLGVQGTFVQIKIYGLEVDLLDFLPYPTKRSLLRKPFRVLRVRREVRAYQRRFEKYQDYDVYYSSNEWDWFLFSLLPILHNRNQLFIYDHYGTTHERLPTRMRSKDYLMWAVFRYITGTDLIIFRRFSTSVAYFPYRRYDVQVVEINPSSEILAKYAYQVSHIPERSILLYEHDMADEPTFVQYEDTTVTLIERLHSEGFKVFVKPHPRVGHSHFLDSCGVTILPKYISGELLPVERFIAVLGIWTTSIAKIALSERDTRAISILDLYTPINPLDMPVMRAYLIKQSGGKVYFANNIDDLLKLITC